MGCNFEFIKENFNTKLRVIIRHAYVGSMVFWRTRCVGHLRRGRELTVLGPRDTAKPPNRVTVEEDRGLVTLHGVVERAYQRSCAEADVRRIPGVIGVKNEITVGAGQEFH